MAGIFADCAGCCPTVMTAGTVGGCFRCGGSGQGAGCACACEGAAAAGGSGLGSGTAGPAELDAPPSFDPEDPPHAGAPAAFATEGGAGGGVVEAARVAGNDACSIKTNERRAPGGNCWRKGAKSSPSSNAARKTWLGREMLQNVWSPKKRRRAGTAAGTTSRSCPCAHACATRHVLSTFGETPKRANTKNDGIPFFCMGSQRIAPGPSPPPQN